MRIERDDGALEMRKTRGRGPWWTLALIALLGVASMGCAGTATVVHRPTVYGYVVADAGPMPANIASHPYVYYRGAPAYWVDGNWYYRSSNGWVVFVDEPRDLHYARVRMPNRAWATARYGVRTGGPVVYSRRTGRYVKASPTVRRAPPVRVSPAPSRRPARPVVVSPHDRAPSKASRHDRRHSKPSKTTRSKAPSRKSRPSRGR